MTSNIQPDRATLLEIFRKMALIRRNDERFRALLRSGQTAHAYYSPRGQEAISAAMAVNLKATDYVVTIYRGVHDHIAKGVPLKELWAEFVGKATGTCKGKGGPMHITHPATGVMVTTGIVGAGLPIANGLGWASQLRKDGRVTVTNFGDGASNIGAFHEALNLASLWKLPVIFLCQNNLFGEHTRFEVATAVKNVADRAAAYSMPGVTVDGNDPIAMWAAAREAVERARDGGGPTLLEARTFRFEGHTFGDNDGYMRKGEKEEALKREPLPLFRKWLIDNLHATEADLAAMEAEMDKQIEEAVQFALSSPWPDASELRRDVYAQEMPA
ncbi:MAG: thiamine pyrophosphate-dependent dehydrogenase E1 component subunit alpha [Gammaproteobacteria bacterium]